ncbi:MAG: cleavage protein [Firmicutes bacterium]|nr:cleavage protein [Bacillota bacterium]
MTIKCSEKCIYEDEGICTLDHIIHSSGTPTNNCPYYKNKYNELKDET